MKHLNAAPALALLMAILISTGAGAANINGNGASLNLPTTDLSSATAQTNGAAARLVSAGTPGVGVVSTNAAGAKVIIEPMNAVAGNSSGPVADFSANPLAGNAPLTVHFTDASNGGLYGIVSWSWDFGDESPLGADQHPVHVYGTPGTYTVTLTISTAGGSVVKIRSSYIAVAQGMPVAGCRGMTLCMGLVLVLGGMFARIQHSPRRAARRG